MPPKKNNIPIMHFDLTPTDILTLADGNIDDIELVVRKKGKYGKGMGEQTGGFISLLVAGIIGPLIAAAKAAAVPAITAAATGAISGAAKAGIEKSIQKRGSGNKRIVNPWIEYVKKISIDNDLPYTEALILAKKTYKKK